MRRTIEIFYDSLLGGAAMSIDDLEVVQSQEIIWLFSAKENETD